MRRGRPAFAVAVEVGAVAIVIDAKDETDAGRRAYLETLPLHDDQPKLFLSPYKTALAMEQFTSRARDDAS